MRRGVAAMQHADRILLVVDDQITNESETERLRCRSPSDQPVTLVRNKTDLSGVRLAVCATMTGSCRYRHRGAAAPGSIYYANT